MCRVPRKLAGAAAGATATATPNPPSTSPEKDSLLLLFAANNDLPSFKNSLQFNPPSSLDIPSPWFTRSSGRMIYAGRTPLMIASLYGSLDVLSHILGLDSVDVNRRGAPDGATALHCAAAGGAPNSPAAVKLLLDAGADADAVDANGNRPGDVISKQFRGFSGFKKEYPLDLSLPDIKNGIFGSDEFRMYGFKVRPCSRAYSHDWTECPFVHPGENARRRDPRKYGYSCVPCPDFRKGCCLKADCCEYAHGVFECWLHPAQYRTRLCKDEGGCSRRVCFFAHRVEELRMVNPATGLVLSPPRSSSLDAVAAGIVMPMSPSSSWLGGSRLKASLSARELEFDLDGYWKSGNSLNNCSDYNEMFGAIEASKLSQLQGGSFSPFEHSMSKTMLNSRLLGFAKKSRSFIDRGAVHRHIPAFSSPIAMSDWGSPDGKLDWGIQGDELSKLRKSATFNNRGDKGNNFDALQHFVKDGSSTSGLSWDYLYCEQERMQEVA